MIQIGTRNYIEKWHGISIRENVVRMKLFVKIVTKKKKKKMTRINVGIPPANLSTKHLIAEHREIKRIPNVVRSGRFSMDGQPKEFKLGTGHVKFFYDKLGYLKHRYISLYEECINRGFKVTNYINAWDDIPICYMGEYKPTDRDISIILQRIKERS
jgi:deoxyribonuclease (pyrimidine dimer)